MKKAFVSVSLAISLAVATLAACSGGVSQGEECGGPQDDCSSNLSCQPIAGRGKSYCCPSPPESSNYQNCHAAK